MPFGQGGPVSGPYGAFNTPNAKGGLSFSGTGGDFGSRFAWYVRQVQQKVSQNWLEYEVDPSITDARRVYITFDIDRSGRPSNIQVEQSSGIPSLDHFRDARLAAHRYFWPIADRIWRPLRFRRVLVRLPEMSDFRYIHSCIAVRY